MFEKYKCIVWRIFDLYSEIEYFCYHGMKPNIFKQMNNGQKYVDYHSMIGHHQNYQLHKNVI